MSVSVVQKQSQGLIAIGSHQPASCQTVNHTSTIKLYTVNKYAQKKILCIFLLITSDQITFLFFFRALFC